jgi:competence protein ComFC
MNQSFKPVLSKGTTYLLRGFDWLFPHRCFGCRQSHLPEKVLNLCVFCWDQIYRPQRVIFENKQDCHIYAAGFYEDLLKRILILSKFKHHSICAQFLSELTIQTFQNIPQSMDMITSVPSNYWRCLRRGVDLPGMLAFELSKSTGIEFRTNVLKKRRFADRQNKLSMQERLRNMTKLFRATEDVRGKNILVIDDVLTTGSTVLACYRALKRKKPASITFLIVAKTRF